MHQLGGLGPLIRRSVQVLVLSVQSDYSKCERGWVCCCFRCRASLALIGVDLTKTERKEEAKKKVKTRLVSLLHFSRTQASHELKQNWKRGNFRGGPVFPIQSFPPTLKEGRDAG